MPCTTQMLTHLPGQLRHPRRSRRRDRRPNNRPQRLGPDRQDEQAPHRHSVRCEVFSFFFAERQERRKERRGERNPFVFVDRRRIDREGERTCERQEARRCCVYEPETRDSHLKPRVCELNCDVEMQMQMKCTCREKREVEGKIFYFSQSHIAMQ